MRKIWTSITAVFALAAAPAFGADMAVKSPPMAAPDPAFSWTGFYVGGNAGYGWNDPTVSYTPNDFTSSGVTCGGAFGGTCVPPASFNIGGALGGIQSGYNWQFNRQWVAGIEADFDWSELKGAGTSNFTLGGAAPGALSSFVSNEDIKWFGTIRGRLGWLPTNNFLVYGTGGFAYGHVDLNATLNSTAGANAGVANGFGYRCDAGPNCFVGSTSQTLDGWTVGAGGEYAISSNITLKAEYLYINLGHAAGVNSVALDGRAVTPSSFTANFGTVSFNVIRAGANWKF
jgi:outer membrane immunogenic protein